MTEPDIRTEIVRQPGTDTKLVMDSVGNISVVEAAGSKRGPAISISQCALLVCVRWFERSLPLSVRNHSRRQRVVRL